MLEELGLDVFDLIDEEPSIFESMSQHSEFSCCSKPRIGYSGSREVSQ